MSALDRQKSSAQERTETAAPSIEEYALNEIHIKIPSMQNAISYKGKTDSLSAQRYVHHTEFGFSPLLTPRL